MFDDLSGALSSGDTAFGVAHERPGTGLTAVDDRLLALGYPHLLLPVEESVPWPKLSCMSQVFKSYPLLDGE